jgi:hypothetical protein
MKPPDWLRRLVSPLHTPAGVLGAALLALQLVRGVLDLGATADFLREIWPAVWAFAISPWGTFATIAAGLILYVWGGRQQPAGPKLITETASGTLAPTEATIREQMEAWLYESPRIKEIYDHFAEKFRFVHERENAIEKSVAEMGADSVPLFKFASRSLDIRMLDAMIAAYPRKDMKRQDVEDLIVRNMRMQNLSNYVSSVSESLNKTWLNWHLKEVMAEAEDNTDLQVRAFLNNERPRIDVLDFRQYMIVESKAAYLRQYLIDQRTEILKGLRKQRAPIQQIYDKRKPPNSGETP